MIGDPTTYSCVTYRDGVGEIRPLSEWGRPSKAPPPAHFIEPTPYPYLYGEHWDWLKREAK